MVWGGLIFFLFWGSFIALIVWSLQAATRRETGQAQGSQSSAPRATSLEIAKERYARGEIGRQEFEQIKKDLAGS